MEECKERNHTGDLKSLSPATNREMRLGLFPYGNQRNRVSISKDLRREEELHTSAQRPLDYKSVDSTHFSSK